MPYNEVAHTTVQGAPRFVECAHGEDAESDSEGRRVRSGDKSRLCGTGQRLGGRANVNAKVAFFFLITTAGLRGGAPREHHDRPASDTDTVVIQSIRRSRALHKTTLEI